MAAMLRLVLDQSDYFPPHHGLFGYSIWGKGKCPGLEFWDLGRFSVAPSIYRLDHCYVHPLLACRLMPHVPVMPEVIRTFLRRSAEGVSDGRALEVARTLLGCR